MKLRVYHQYNNTQILFKTIKSKIRYETPCISSIKWYENKAEKTQITTTQICFCNPRGDNGKHRLKFGTGDIFTVKL
jgi:hypothetical protein